MKRILLLGVGGALLISGLMAFKAYDAIFEANINPEKEQLDIKIPSKSSFQSLYEIIKSENILIDTTSFLRVAKWMKFSDRNVKSGSYKIEQNWNNRQLINHLRSGNELPIKVTYNNVRTVEEVAGKIANYLEPDSTALIEHILSSQTLANLNLTKENILSLFIPNTYQFYWDMSPDDIVNRLSSEHESFWTKNDRTEKLDSLGLTKEEVYTLASIVEKESIRDKEKPIIAGVYLNRLNTGMLLQADPTVVFGVGDFDIRRVLNVHLRHDSPYNTYMYQGLPPGPIYMPSIKSIDAVLNPADTDYIFFCAKPGYNSEHAFATTVGQHEKNARAYRSWLNKERIKK